MKKLIVIGASLAAFAIAVWLVRSQPADDTGTAKSSQPASPLPPPGADESAEVASDAQPPEPVALAPELKSAPTTRARPTPMDEQPSQPTAPVRTEEAQQMAECRALWERKRSVEQAAREAESKDSGWAYPTEQKLREYLSRRFQTIPIEVTRIDCRTTFCEIKAQGFAPEGAHEFRSALEAVHQESWNDFTWSSFSQEEEGDKLIYSGEVRRKQSYATHDEQRDEPAEIACMALVSRQNLRTRATFDSEPRDPGWADQMEQLLRMHLEKQLTKHPVEQLEIICRTSLCQIKARGKSDDALDVLRKAMLAVDSEPWANLRSGEHGASHYGDGWTAEFKLVRR